MSIYNVMLDKEQIDVLKRSCIKSMLDNTRKMDDILLRHLHANDYNLSDDKQYIKTYLEFATQKAQLEYFDAISKGKDK
nr:MAG TPA: SEC14-like protein 2 synthesis, squalene, 2,3-oxidosqualene, SEC14-like [Caudoviricetes sp.]